jgi:hypothetical protein
MIQLVEIVSLLSVAQDDGHEVLDVIASKKY